MKDGVFVTLQKPRKKLLEMKVDHVFVGKKSPTGGYDGLKPSEAEGNSILVEKGSKYIYIGHEIYEFSPVEGDTIEAYYSDIGNSDVPYPYAVGKTHVYILLEKAAVDKSFFDMKKGIYDQYYNATTRLDMCLRGFRDCKDKEKAKATRKEMKSKTRRMKSKLIQKRL
jgi:predicted GIY-YIG superfamily endonuclease